MRVLVIVKATSDSERNLPATAWTDAMMAAMSRFNDALRDAGLFVMAAGLQPSSAGCRIAFDGDSRSLIPGPFLPADELIAGFWIWDVADMDEAVAWVRRCPNPMPGPSIIEIRPFHG